MTHYFLFQRPFEGATKIGHTTNHGILSYDMSPIDFISLWQKPAQKIRKIHVPKHKVVDSRRNKLKVDMRITMCFTLCQFPSHEESVDFRVEIFTDFTLSNGGADIINPYSPRFGEGTTLDQPQEF